MIRDRGRMKWTAMMLPEHVKILREWAKEDAWEEPVQLDEQKLEELNETVVNAKENKQKITVQYYAEHYYETVVGTIRSVDAIKKELEMIGEEGAVYAVPLGKILNVELVE
jgi:hypothetical protein